MAATLDNQSTVGGYGLEDGALIDLLTELPLGAHTFSVTSADRLGNRNSAAVTFTIIVTAASIKEDVTSFVARGEIDPLVARALPPILNAAQQQRDRGHCDVAAAIYRAFIDNVTPSPAWAR